LSPRSGRLRALTGVVLAAACVAALSGCTLFGGPETLDDDQLSAIAERVSQAQPALDAVVRAETATCEGLCQHVSVELIPRTPEYTALDVGIAIHEADVALEEKRITAFDYCFAWRDWELAEAQYLDARLSEVRGLGYGDVFRDPQEQRPMDECYSFASISGAEQLEEFVAENGASEG